MKHLELHPEGLETRLRRAKKRDSPLVDYLVQEIEDAFSARAHQEDAWQEQLRQYAAVPKSPYRNVPIENAPNIEIPLGAMNVDDIYARMLELIFGIAPTLTARATGEPFQHDAKAVQKWINWGAAEEFNLRPAAEQVLLDDCQLGTGVYYIPWVESVKKTDVMRVKEVGPRILAVPPEDFIAPGGSGSDLQKMPWISHRTWLSDRDIADGVRLRGWVTDGVESVAALSAMRQRREALGRTMSNAKLKKLYEIHNVYVRYDYDGDGIDEELLCLWDRTSRKILWLGYQPYDWRPYEAMRYQLQSYLFNGLGILELCRPFQDQVTEMFNAWQLNGMLANCRMWKSRTGTLPDGIMQAYPGKNVEVNNPEDIAEMRMSDEYSSAFQQIEATISLAQQRTGNNMAQQSKPISTSRTSGVTAMSLMQQANRRFTGAFDGARLATSAATRQCLYRYRERLLAGDLQAERNITRVMHEEAPRVTGWLKSEGFEEQVQVELTASSASVNRDADRQNALMLANLYSQYYQQAFQTLAIAANPQTPEPVRHAAAKVSEKAYELMDMVSRTFDLIQRDPTVALVSFDEEYQTIEQQAGQGMQQITQLIQQFAQGQGGGGNGGPTPEGMPGPAMPLPNSGTGAV